MILSYKVKLDPSTDQSQILSNTLDQYKTAINSPLIYGFKNHISNGVELHKATYYPLKEQVNLPAQLICSARCKATEILKSIRSKTKGKFNTKQPQSHKFPSIRYDRNSCTITDEFIRVSTTEGRIQIPFIQGEWIERIDFSKVQKSCELQRKPEKDVWLLTVFVETEEPKQVEITEEAEEVGGVEKERIIGIDRGCKHIAVCSDNTFFDSKQLRNVKGKYSHLRKRLQSKGTKSAKRLLKSISGKEHRFVRDVNHCISKQITEMPYDIIVLEKLNIKRKKELGKRFNSILNGWSYNQLEIFIDYKAKLRGKKVEFVDARYTSQKCSVCGHISKSNRYSSAFECKACGYQLHADLNASRNIRDNFKVIQGISLDNRVLSITHTNRAL